MSVLSLNNPKAAKSAITESKKRGRAEESEKEQKRKATSDKMEECSRSLSTLTFHSDYVRASRNLVYLAPDIFEKVFGKDAQNGSYLKVANLVFRAVRDVSLFPWQCDLSFITHEQISKDIISYRAENKLWLTRFISWTDELAKINTVHFRVSPFGHLNTLGTQKTQISVLKSSLEQLIRETFSHDVLTLRQSLFVLHPIVGPLKIVVQKWTHDDFSQEDILYADSISYYGRCTPRTQITLSSGAKNDLVLVEEFNPDSIEEFLFTITKVEDISVRVFSANSQASLQDAWKKGMQPLPLAMPLSEIAAKIRNKLVDTLLKPGRTDSFSHSKDWRYEVELTRVKGNADKAEENQSEDNDEQKVFRLKNTHLIRIIPSQHVLLTQNTNEAKLAQEMKFEILEMELDYSLDENEIPILSVHAISEQIRNSSRLFVAGEKIAFTVDRAKYLVKLIRAGGMPWGEREQNNIKNVWSLNEQTEVIIFSNPKLKLQLVDNRDPLPLQTLRVKVSLAGGAQPKRFLQLGGKDEGEEGEKIIIQEEELQKVFRQILPQESLLIEKQTLRGLSQKGHHLEFKLERFKADSKDKMLPAFGFAYHCLPETEVIFEGDKQSDLVISSKPKDINFDNIGAKLLEFGIGGMPEKFKDLVSRTILSRSTFSEHIQSLGQKPSRGLLLYGPPGTGKTLLARKLGEILGVTKERIQLFTGSQIWNKWLGESEKNIRKMFQKARQDQIRFGKNSPLHLLIIDEIDAFLQDRNNAERRYETSVVNTFIAELDGIASEGEDSLENVIVIGLTNYPDRIDEAAKRPGRLFPHIHIGMPDVQGRKEIFNIHTKLMKDKGFLGEDINHDEMALMTVGKTGAFIEGLVTAAAERSLKRLWEQKVSLEQLKSHPAAKIIMQDFREAFLECSHQKKPKGKQSFSLSTPLDIKGISQRLKENRIGGIPEEVLRFLSDLTIFQQYKEYYYAVKHPFPRGVLLYGPHGTGKTRLAKSLKTLFGLQGQQFQYIQASELWPLQGAKLQDKLEKLLKPAKDASKDLKHEAPLHIIVIDQLDGIYQHKREKDDYDFSVMNSFMAELETLFDDDQEEVHNLLILGIVQRSSFGISDGILRHGRFGKHIEMRIPNRSERKEIFEIYLSELVQRNQLDPNLEMRELLRMTEDLPGAYVEGLVNAALIGAMRRTVWGRPSIDGSMINTLNFILKMDDFEHAVHQLQAEQKWKSYVI
jgi:SpoVK/Ycf46/Vps4 family AAA+-type ATPase